MSKIKTIGKVNALWRKCRIYQVSLHCSKQEQDFRTKHLNSVDTNLYLFIHISTNIASVLDNGIKLLLQNKFNKIFYYVTERFQRFLVVMM